LLKEIAGDGNAVVSCGGGTPLREENISIMKENGKVVLLSAKPETIFQRVRYSHNRPLLENNMNVEYIAQLLEKRIDKYERAADFVVVTDDRSKQEIAEEIISKINK
jgi:shikimate kinase